MISIDKYAYISALRNKNPLEKFMFAIITLLVCIFANNMVDSIIILIVMALITILKGKILPKEYLKFLMLPIVFLLVGIITIAINEIGNSKDVIFSFVMFNIKFGCTKYSLFIASNLFFKALASVSCLYFLTLTTPVFEILSILKKLKVPKLFVELMLLVYRFIFVLLDTADKIFISQNSRLGYSNIKTGYNSLGKLITALFISSYKRSQDIFMAMEARGYQGDIELLEEHYRLSKKDIFIIIIFDLALVVIAIVYKFWGGF